MLKVYKFFLGWKRYDIYALVRRRPLEKKSYKESMLNKLAYTREWKE